MLSDNTNSLQELLALRKLQRAHQGIDVTKLNQGDTKRKRKKAEEEEAPPDSMSFGLQSRVRKEADPLDDDEYVGSTAPVSSI